MASAFFVRTIENDGWPEKAVIDKSGANFAGLQNMNWMLLLQGWFRLTEILQVKYLTTMIEQDHRFIKKLTRPIKGFKSFQSASAIAVSTIFSKICDKARQSDLAVALCEVGRVELHSLS